MSLNESYIHINHGCKDKRGVKILDWNIYDSGQNVKTNDK